MSGLGLSKSFLATKAAEVKRTPMRRRKFAKTPKTPVGEARGRRAKDGELPTAPVTRSSSLGGAKKGSIGRKSSFAPSATPLPQTPTRSTPKAMALTPTPGRLSRRGSGRGGLRRQLAKPEINDDEFAFDEDEDNLGTISVHSSMPSTPVRRVVAAAGAKRRQKLDPSQQSSSTERMASVEREEEESDGEMEKYVSLERKEPVKVERKLETGAISAALQLEQRWGHFPVMMTVGGGNGGGGFVVGEFVGLDEDETDKVDLRKPGESWIEYLLSRGGGVGNVSRGRGRPKKRKSVLDTFKAPENGPMRPLFALDAPRPEASRRSLTLFGNRTLRVRNSYAHACELMKRNKFDDFAGLSELSDEDPEDLPTSGRHRSSSSTPRQRSKKRQSSDSPPPIRRPRGRPRKNTAGTKRPERPSSPSEPIRQPKRARRVATDHPSWTERILEASASEVEPKYTWTWEDATLAAAQLPEQTSQSTKEPTHQTPTDPIPAATSQTPQDDEEEEEDLTALFGGVSHASKDAETVERATMAAERRAAAAVEQALAARRADPERMQGSYFDLHRRGVSAKRGSNGSWRQMDAGTARLTLRGVPGQASVSRAGLLQEHASQFPIWRARMMAGWGVCLYGVGSKRQLALSLAAWAFPQDPVLVIDGSSPVDDIHSGLAALCRSFGLPPPSRRPTHALELLASAMGYQCSTTSSTTPTTQSPSAFTEELFQAVQQATTDAGSAEKLARGNKAGADQLLGADGAAVARLAAASGRRTALRRNGVAALPDAVSSSWRKQSDRDLDLVETAAARMHGKRLTVVVPSLDGPALRDSPILEPLLDLLSAPRVRAIATLDHISGSLVLPPRHRQLWTYAHTDTLEPYTHETSFAASTVAVAKTTRSKGVARVLATLTQNHRNVLQFIAKATLDNAPLSRDELFHKAHSNLIVSSAANLRLHLVELTDHAIVRVQRTQRGEVLCADLPTPVLREIANGGDGSKALEEMEQDDTNDARQAQRDAAPDDDQEEGNEDEPEDNESTTSQNPVDQQVEDAIAAFLGNEAQAQAWDQGLADLE